jgi:iron complex outermembrane receptor protein
MWEGEFYGTTGLSDTVAVNLSLYGMDQKDGWGYNPRTGEETFTQSGYLARTKLLWTPSPDTRVVVGANYDYGRTYQGPTQGVFPGALGPDGVTRYISRYVINSNNKGNGTTETWGANLHVEHDFRAFRTNSIFAWNHLESLVHVDADSTPVVINEADPFYTDNDTYTAEFHILSPSDSRINWIAGAYFLKDDLVVDEQLNTNRGSNRLVMPMSTRSWSLFGETNIPIFENTKLTLGVRYTHDKKDYLYQNYNASVPGFPLLPVAPTGCAPLINLGGTCFGEKTWADFSYRVALDHQLTENTLLFASWNRGFQSGAFNVTSPNSLVNPVTVDAYEVGAKNEFFGRRVRLNISGFYYDYQNLQARANIGGVVQVFNAAQATIKGVDLDVDARASERLTLRASIEYLDATYDEFLAFENIVPRPGGGNQRIGTRNVSGFPVVRSPKWTANLGATYSIPTSIGEFTLNGNYSYNDGFDWEPGGSLKQSAYSVINATIVWTSPGEAYEVSLAGRNLTDEDYFLKGGRAGTSDSYVPAAPRTFMVTVSRHF